MNRESSYVNSLKRLRYLTGGSPVLLVFSAWASYVGPVSTESEFRCVGWVVVGGRELLSSAVWSLVYKQTQGQVQQWQWHCISLLSHSPLQLNRVLHTCLHASIVSVSSVLVYNEKVYCLKYIVLNGASLLIRAFWFQTLKCYLLVGWILHLTVLELISYDSMVR